MNVFGRIWAPFFPFQKHIACFSYSVAHSSYPISSLQVYFSNAFQFQPPFKNSSSVVVVVGILLLVMVVTRIVVVNTGENFI